MWENIENDYCTVLYYNFQIKCIASVLRNGDASLSLVMNMHKDTVCNIWYISRSFVVGCKTCFVGAAQQHYLLRLDLRWLDLPFQSWIISFVANEIIRRCTSTNLVILVFYFR
jgi:hypothetical protein